MSTEEIQELVGHSRQEGHIFRLIQENRLPHAMMLAGPKGIGKAAFAMQLAARLLAGDQQKPAAEEQGGLLFDLPPAAAAPASDSLFLSAAHPIHRRLAAGSHSDFLLLRPEFDEKKKEYKPEITIEAARKVGEFMSLTPAESAWRVAVIDSIDELNRNAANALLKVLEEPPPKAILILVSHNPGRLLPTIRSRCQVVSFAPLSLSDFLRALTQRQLPITAEEGSALGLLSGFSPGHAIPLKEAGGPAVYGALLEMVRNPTAAAIQQFLDAYVKKDGEQGWQMLGWIVDLFLTRLQKAAFSASAPEIVPGEWAALQALAAGRPVDDWFDLWSRTAGMWSEASRLYLDKRLVLQQFLYSLSNPSSIAA